MNWRSCGLSVVFLVAMNNIVSGQDSTLELSRYEKFKSRTGKMFRTDRGLVGEFRDKTVEMNRVIDLENGDSSKAISIKQKTPVYNFTSGSFYIDYDEMLGVIKALEYLKSEIAKGKPKYEPFFEYVTSNDVIIFCYYTESGLFKGWSIEMAKLYHYTRSSVPGSGISIRPKDIDEVMALFKQTLKVVF